MLKTIAVTIALLSASTALAQPGPPPRAPAPPPPVYAVQAGTLITDAALPTRGPATVVVQGGRILRIEDGATAPSGAIVVDMRDKTVLPGLIDAHVHLTVDATISRAQGISRKYSEPYFATMGLKNAAATVRAGFTTVRDLGGPVYASLAVRDAVRDGAFPGPRILVAGLPVTMIGGHGDQSTGFAPEIAAAVRAASPQAGVCTGAQECAKSVRAIAALGVDVIKVMVTGGVLSDGGNGLEQHLDDAELAAIVTTARRLGLKVAAHAHGARGIEAAARAGVDSIEHGTFADDAAVAAMKARGTYMVPTLLVTRGLEMFMGRGIYSANTEAKAKEALAQWGQALARANRAGVKVALGTDAAVFPHGINAQEVALMVDKGGMTPRAALVAATSGAADLLGLARETGTIEAGKAADLIAVEGDPLRDPAALTKVRYVMAAGRPVSLN